MKLAIITALHGRYRLTRLFLDYWRTLDVPGVELLLSCAITTDEYKMREMVTREYPEWSPVYAPNMPLTTKFAANMQNVEAWKPDAMMIIGSDDFVTPSYIQRSIDAMQCADLVGTHTVYYMEYGTDQIIRQHVTGDPIGAGRVLSRRLLEHLEWMPWDTATPSLDMSMMHQMKLNGILPEIIEEDAMLDVKSKDQHGQDTNQTTYRTVRKWNHTPIDGHAFLNEHFPQLIRPLLYENSYSNRAA